MAWTPPGKRKANLDRRFDQTQLKSTGHGRTVHRDYAAHFFRWGFASNFVVAGKTRILDIGCGQEQPMIRTLTNKLATVPQLYVGVDLNPIQKPSGVAWTRTHAEFSFVDRWKELRKAYPRPFDLITCFEVIEHMHPPDGLELLRAARELAAPKARFILSTPCYDGKKAAANHLHEYTIPELQKLIDKSGGWEVERRFGTFGNWPQMRKVVTLAERNLYEDLHQYYSHEVLSCFLAPKYPDQSRNNSWLLRPKS